MNTTEEKTVKKIYDYDNYRDYLRDFYLAAKAKDKKFSFRYFARVAGLASPTSLKRVIDGDRNLTSDGIEKFAKALKLNHSEKDFFEKLVKFNQAKNSEVRQALARNLMRSRGYKRLRPLSEAQFNCLSHWYFLPIREMTNLPDFNDDPNWIAHRLTPNISGSEAKRALDELIKLGLLERDNRGRLVQTSSDITTGDEVVNSAVPRYHRELLNKAGESLDIVPREKRDISAMTLGISTTAIIKIKEMIQNFRKEIVEVLSSEGGAPESVYQLNFQFFPVVQVFNKDQS